MTPGWPRARYLKDFGMNLCPIGQSGLSTAPLVLGGNVFGWNVDLANSCAILDAFIDAGFNMVDTADSYSRWPPGHVGGESEMVIGRWLKRSGKRDRVLIATKIGNDMGEGKCLKKDYVRRAAEACLRRLQVDCIDLLQTHFDDGTTPVEETLSAYADLIRQGKVRAIGASNLSPARLKASLAASRQLGIPRYECLQPNYNLYDRKTFETDYAPICEAEGLGVITYYSLAGGFLTGKYRSADEASQNPARGGKVKGYFDARGMAVLRALDEIATRQNATPAQVALAWLMAQPLVTAPIASATGVAQLAETMNTPSLKLTPEDMITLDRASA
jgi:aryl-alcohol dehydrogenase-like predicted oxidoreductase